MMFNRERFLYWLLAGGIGWQMLIFSFGTYSCVQKGGLTHCPALGERFETFTTTTLGAVLGLIGGAAAIATAQGVKNKNDSIDHERKSKERADQHRLTPPDIKR